MNSRSTRVVLLGALTLGAVACSNILGFQSFRAEGDDASVEMPSPDGTGDATMGVPVDDATALDAGPPDAALAAPDAMDDGNSVCPGGGTLCGDACTDLTRDKDNCGGCGVPCSADMSCKMSACACPSEGYHFCANLGICSSNSSANSCGPTSCTTCAAPINGTNACTDAGCGACFAPLTLCDRGTPNAECVDLTSNPAHCGACDKACHIPDGGSTATCTASNCIVSCNQGLTGCPAASPTSCADLTSDTRNCGACGKLCPAHDSGPAATCIDGGCH